MALFKPYKITSDKLEDLTIKEGQIIITTDTKKLYVDVSATERIEITADAEVDLSDYVTTSTLTSTIGEEASARQKQDQLLEQAIDDKLGADDIIAGSNVQVNHDDESGHITISATDTKYTAGAGLTLSGTEFGIADGGIIGKYLDDNCVMERNIVVGSVTSDKIPALAITTPKLADNAVTAIKMADDAVATRSIQNGAVTADKLAEGVIPDVEDVTLASLGVTATAEELNYVDGVTSNIQTQLNDKAAISHSHTTSDITSGTFSLDRIPTITDAKISGISANKITGTISSANLPSYVDDVLEYNGTPAFPEDGEAGKIYVDTSTNKTYRWSGSGYVEISASLALGTTSSTAFRGDYGNTAYTHATAKGSAFSSGLYKITTNSQGHVTAATAVTKNDITALGIPAQDTNTNTTYELTKSGSTITLEGSDGSSTSVTDSNTVYTHPTTSGNKHIPAGGSSGQILRWSADGTAAWGADNNTNTTYTLSKSGSTITLTGSDGKKTSVTDSNTTYSLSSFGITATAAELNKLDGVTTTATQLNYLNTLTSNVQTQLNGKAASSHTHSYLPLSGGTLTGRLTANGKISTPTSGGSWINGKTVTNAAYCVTTQPDSTGNAYYPFFAAKSGSGHTVNIGCLGNSWGFYGYYSSRTANGTDWSFCVNAANGNWSSTGQITASQFNGKLNGNASTATTATQANYWTTARTLTFTGNVTGSVSVRGNANMSCTLTLANDSVTSAKIAANAVTASEIASGAVGLSELSSAVGTVAVQSATPTDSHVKLWIKV